MNELRSRLGRAVKRLRQHRGLTQQQLADKAGLHRTYLSDVERGARNLSLEVLFRLSASLETPISEIFKQVEADVACLSSTLRN